MSSDFTTGKNKVITKECSFLMLSDKLGTLFKDYNLDRNFFYNLYKDEDLFDSTLTDESSRWDLFTRYKLSNNYSSNKFDDVYILQKSAEKSDLYDKTNETIDSRKALILNECSTLIENGICMYPNFQLTGFFPHLDKPNKITSIDGVKDGNGCQNVPCFEYGFATFFATIDYTDSCGKEIQEPVPFYNDYTVNEDVILNEKYFLNTLDDIELLNSANIKPTFSWSIETNSSDVMVKNDKFDSNVIEIATVSGATAPSINLKLTYTE
jgi:hypothetical protein